MCEFCTKHGAGRTWYLQLKNYSRDRLRSDARFRELVDWLAGESEHAVGLDTLRKLVPIPGIGLLARWAATRRLKRIHFGQVLPLSDVRKVFGMVDAIHLYPCVCRKHLSGEDDASYCFALGSFLREFLEEIPTYNGGGRELTVEEAVSLATDFEQRGLLHTIWTLDTPFIVGICSCKPGECMAMELNNSLRTKVMFKAEELFEIDAETCVACGKCVETCYFDAIRKTEQATVVIDAERCYGCGLCRTACPVDAPHPVARQGKLALPAAF